MDTLTIIFKHEVDSINCQWKLSSMGYKYPFGNPKDFTGLTLILVDLKDKTLFEGSDDKKDYGPKFEYSEWETLCKILKNE